LPANIDGLLMEDKQLDDVGAMPPGSQSYAAAPQRRARLGSTCVGAARRGELVDRGAWPASWRADAPGGRAGEQRAHLKDPSLTSPGDQSYHYKKLFNL
jgi:hypothetical protein